MYGSMSSLCFAAKSRIWLSVSPYSSVSCEIWTSKTAKLIPYPHENILGHKPRLFGLIPFCSGATDVNETKWLRWRGGMHGLEPIDSPGLADATDIVEGEGLGFEGADADRPFSCHQSVGSKFFKP